MKKKVFLDTTPGSQTSYKTTAPSFIHSYNNCLFILRYLLQENSWLQSAQNSNLKFWVVFLSAPAVVSLKPTWSWRFCATPTGSPVKPTKWWEMGVFFLVVFKFANSYSFFLKVKPHRRVEDYIKHCQHCDVYCEFTVCYWVIVFWWPHVFHS